MIKKQLRVTDATIAEWLLLIIMSPAIAPSAIRSAAPALQKQQLDAMYELVATWMLAEPARLDSSMLSGIMELELIEAGKRTFKQSLTSLDVDAHPMSHIGSESQGREMEAAGQSIGSGRGVPKDINVNKVLAKQERQMAASYGTEPGKAQEELKALVRFYTQTLEETIGRR